MTVKIETDRVGWKTTIRLSGRVRSDFIDELERQLKGDPTQLVLDLEGVTLVDVEVVKFLAAREDGGVQLLHCPPYIREWMIRERNQGV